MNYEPNTIRWQPGDLVIHDADAVRNRASTGGIAKGFRGALLEGLKKAADQRRGMRAEGLDSDGESLSLDYEEAIFVRINGANVCMTRDQFEFYKQEQQKKRKEG